MLLNNLDAGVAEDPNEVIVYGGTGQAARNGGHDIPQRRRVGLVGRGTARHGQTQAQQDRQHQTARGAAKAHWAAPEAAGAAPSAVSLASTRRR